MLLNYIKLAFKVLGRKKFYTFISLFGISFTLMILMVMTAFLDNQLGSYPPLSEGDRMLFLSRASLQFMAPDTTWAVDSSLVNGLMQYDSTLNVSEVNQSTWTSDPGYKLLNEYMRELPSAENYTFYSPNHHFDLFLMANKLSFEATYTDARYWQVFDFPFLEGGPYQASQVESSALVAVISEKARRAYFGSGVQALGREMEVDNKHFQVIGVVDNVSQTHGYAHSDLYLPLTHIRPDMLNSPDLLGFFQSTFLASSPDKVRELEAEIHHTGALVPLLEPDKYNLLELSPYTPTEKFAVGLFFDEDKHKSMRRFLLIFGGMAVLFLLLPTLNLINVNVTRIMERSSEIGVRKAFGAHTGNLLVQFVFENILLTLIGGLIGCVLGYVLIQVINDSQVLSEVILRFNPLVFLYGFLTCVFFGILSGLLPAWRMSRLHVVTALKQNAL